jgi:hypothetical protein
LHLMYLRPDLQISEPLRPPYEANFEVMEDYIARIQKFPAVHVVIEIRPPEEVIEFDQSVSQYMRQHAGQQFVYLR